MPHAQDCDTCARADAQVGMTAFLDWETDMLEQRPQDVGIYDPLLVKMWENEHSVNEVVRAVKNENLKYYGQENVRFNIDLPLPPRPDIEE